LNENNKFLKLPRTPTHHIAVEDHRLCAKKVNEFKNFKLITLDEDVTLSLDESSSMCSSSKRNGSA
jgi:hypothetical protein